MSGEFVCMAGGGLLRIVPAQCDTETGIDDVLDDLDDTAPDALCSLAIHPNPFNPQTTVSFSLE